MLPDRNKIICITQNVFGSMAGLEPAVAELEEAIDGPRMTGVVQISGNWQGAILVQTTQELARTAAAAMLQIGADELTAGELQDALAELSNMIGGNIKGHVPGPSYLSMPTVAAGSDFELHLKDARVVSDATMSVAGQPLCVLMCESIES